MDEWINKKCTEISKDESDFIHINLPPKMYTLIKGKEKKDYSLGIKKALSQIICPLFSAVHETWIIKYVIRLGKVQRNIYSETLSTNWKGQLKFLLMGTDRPDKQFFFISLDKEMC